MEEVIVKDNVGFREDAKQGNGHEDESPPRDGHFFYDDEGLDGAYETQYDVRSCEYAGTNDEDKDDDFLVHEGNDILEPKVDVHLFGISIDVPFDNIGVTNLVSDDVLEGEVMDVINADSFDSDPGTGLTGPNHGMKVRPSGSSGPTTRIKKRKYTSTNDDSQACSSTLDVHDKRHLCPWVLM
nr:hypothetical protein [Tanacetum cinerariifolium]